MHVTMSLRYLNEEVLDISRNNVQNRFNTLLYLKQNGVIGVI